MSYRENEAVECVNGLGDAHRWTGAEMMHRTVFQVPAPIVAYNKYMNAVDVVDQSRRTNAAVRKESRIYMSFYTMILDLEVNNAFALYNWIKDNEGTNST